jgi:hypothetical protein
MSMSMPASTSARRVRVIDTASALSSLRRRAHRRGIDRVVLALGFASDDTRRLERALNHGLRSCGCETGATFAMIGIVAQFASAALGADGLRWPSLADAGRFTLVMLGFALAGKIVGLAVAELRFRRAIDAGLRGIDAWEPGHYRSEG